MSRLKELGSRGSIARTPTPRHPNNATAPSPVFIPDEKLPKSLLRKSVTRYVINRWGLRGLKIANLATLAVIGTELIAGLAAFGMFHQMNTSQESRQFYHKKFPWALEKFYQLAEYHDPDTDIRKNDLEKWSAVTEAKD